MTVQTFLNICGVPTKVVTLGPGLAEVNTSEDVFNIVLIIPGNPGYTPFYYEFMQEIHNRLKCSVWITSHAGHEIPKDFHQTVPSLAGNEALFDLRGQVLHKVSFVEQFVPSNARLYLIGHSIGAYMIIQLLKESHIASRVVGSYLLFPTIERLSETPNGSFYKKIFTLPPQLAVSATRLYSLLPNFIQTFLVELVGMCTAIPKNYRGIIKEFLHPMIVERMIALVTNELQVVKERDDQTLKANKNTIKIYYSATDGWAPEDYYLRLKRDLPDVDAELCPHNYEHAFVLRNSKEIANLVVDWIRMKHL